MSESEQRISKKEKTEIKKEKNGSLLCRNVLCCQQFIFKHLNLIVWTNVPEEIYHDGVNYNFSNSHNQKTKLENFLQLNDSII